MSVIWHIGPVEIPNKVTLAPMAGITDKAFRLIARDHGCGLVYTEMISAKALTYNNQKTKAILDIEGEKQPISVQLFGSEPDVMAEGARIAVLYGAQIIDVNMGCPVPKVVKCGEGSALLEDPQRAQEIIRAMVDAVKVPITVKIRLGWNRENIVALEFARRMEAAGVSAVAVHGRTRDMFYSGKADWSFIQMIKEAIKVPVIGNGDIWSAQDAERLLDETGCDSVMLGRGAMGNPWLISQVVSYLKGEEAMAPTPREKILGAKKHLDLMIVYKGESIGVKEMRTHLAWYLKGLPHTAPLKETIFKAKTKDEVVNLLDAYLEKHILS